MANELMLPPYLYPSKAELELADTVGQFNPAFGYAVSQRVDYGATRWLTAYPNAGLNWPTVSANSSSALDGYKYGGSISSLAINASSRNR